MNSFFKKLIADIGNIKNLPFAFLAFLLALLDPINKLVKLFKELPLVIVISGIYLAILLVWLHIKITKEIPADEKGKKKKPGQADLPNRFNDKERKRANYFFLIVSILFAVYLGYWITGELKKKKEKESIAREKAKAQQETNAKINILTAFFSSKYDEDHFSKSLIARLKEELESANLDVINKRDSSYLEDITGVEKKIADRIKKIGFSKGIYNYGDYDPQEKHLVLRILIHNLDSCISIGSSQLPDKDCLISMEKDIRIEYKDKIDSTAGLIVAILLQSQKKYAASQEMLKKLSEQDVLISADSRSAIYKLQANNEMGEGNFDKAIAFYNQAREIQPANNKLKFNNAVAYAANKEFSSARSLLADLKDTAAYNKKALSKYIETNLGEFPQKGVIKTGNKYDLFLNEKHVLSNYDSIQNISIRNTRYFLAFNNGKSELYDSIGKRVEYIEGTPTYIMLKKWVPNRKYEFGHN